MPAREVCRYLRQQGAFADARIAAEQNEGTAHDPAAEDGVEFPDARRNAFEFFIADFGKGERFGKAAHIRKRGTGGFFARVRGLDEFFLQRVEIPAARTFAQPFGSGVAAFRADELRGGRFDCHIGKLL